MSYSKNNMEGLDVSFLLHSHSERLISVSELLEPILEYLAPAPCEENNGLTEEQVEAEVLSMTSKLVISIERIIQELSGDAGNRVVNKDEFDNAVTNYESLKKYVHPDDRRRAKIPFLFSRISDSIRIYSMRGVFNIRKEYLKDAVTKANAIRRAICLYYLKESVQRVIEMREQSKALQSYFTRQSELELRNEIFPASKLLEYSIREQTQYSKSRGIKINKTNKLHREALKGDLAHLIRGLSNILNNALKYNYRLLSEDVWVEIKAYAEDDCIVYETESWGTPIAKDELESRDIFKPGQRGAYASLQGRTGSGIGLADANLIAKEHNGSITIESFPARGGADDHDKPYVTRVFMRIPIYQQANK
jgi:signal transduction histidine kinase